METLRELYPECTAERDGYEAGPGSIYTFAEGERAYRFDVSDGSKFASSLPSKVDGRQVSLMVNPPFAETSAAIQVPRSCPVFQGALVELQALGVKHIRFFNQPTGGFKDFDVLELQSA